jgi:hypothetical protein
MAEQNTTVDRSIVRCSVTQQILAIFLQPRLNDFSRAGPPERRSVGLA